MVDWTDGGRRVLVWRSGVTYRAGRQKFANLMGVILERNKENMQIVEEGGH